MSNPFMTEAIKEAYKGIEAGDGGPFGAVVVKNGQIIGRGHNQVLLYNDCTCHGEIMAIRNACQNINNFSLAGSEIYSTAEPCPMCLGTVLWARINTIYYGCTRKNTDKIGFSDDEFYERLSITTSKIDLVQIDLDECLKLFHDYEQIQNRRIY